MDFWWLIVNVILAAGAPFLANLLQWALDGGKPMLLSAYRDGQLGFVAVGWCAAALYDIAGHPTVFPHKGNWQVFFGMMLALSALFAAKGGREPVLTPLPAIPVGTTLNWWELLKRRIKHFKTASWSVGLGVLSLIGMLLVHLSLPE